MKEQMEAAISKAHRGTLDLVRRAAQQSQDESLQHSLIFAYLLLGEYDQASAALRGKTLSGSTQQL